MSCIESISPEEKAGKDEVEGGGGEGDLRIVEGGLYDDDGTGLVFNLMSFC
jgi:hypothetical protein